LDHGRRKDKVEQAADNRQFRAVSREVWLVISGAGRVSWADQTATLRAGEAIAFDTKVPHQVQNIGSEPLKVFSVYWKQADRGAVGG
jgi:mannose-6-phosphate isomerase-like protein (cupin superfamily)